MNQKLKKLFSAVTSACMLASMPLAYSGNLIPLKVNAGNSMTVEYLERGISAINTGSGRLVSWRYLADDDNNIIEDVDNIIGLDSLNHFGEYEADSVHVRNDKKKTDYEILLDEEKYSNLYPRPLEEE